MLSLGIDLGTSSVKVCILNSNGAILAQAQSPPKGEMSIQSPQAGWAEQDPKTWWSHVGSAIHSLPADLRLKIGCIGVAYQMHGLVLLNAEGEPVRPAILWCDSRATRQGDQIAKQVGLDYLAKSILNHPGNFTLAKLKWVADHEPETVERASTALLPGDFIVFKLTGERSTTKGGLSEMIGWNFTANHADDQLWEATGCSVDLRPTIFDSFSLQGKVSHNMAAYFGFDPDCKITYRAGDQPNNAFGLGVHSPSTAALSAGTSGVIYGVTNSSDEGIIEGVNRFLHVNGDIGLLMCLNGVGSALAWARQVICPKKGFEDMTCLADKANRNEAPLFFPFGAGAERILGNRTAGGFENLDFNRHGQAELLFSAFEGITFAFALGAESMANCGWRAEQLCATESGLLKSHLFRELSSNSLQLPIQFFEGDGSVAAARGAFKGAGVEGEPLQQTGSIEPSGDIDSQRFETWKACLKAKLPN